MYIRIRTLHTFKHITIYIYRNKYLHTNELTGLCCSFTVSRKVFTNF